MTVGLVCAAVVAVRFVEEILRRIVSWLTSRREAKKQYFYKRIVAIVTPELHDKIKAHVTLRNMTITEYVLEAVSEKLAKEVLCQK